MSWLFGVLVGADSGSDEGSRVREDALGQGGFSDHRGDAIGEDVVVHIRDRWVVEVVF